MSQVFLHIGLHKTGTSYLQSTVFPLLEGVTSFSVNSHILDLAVGNNDKLLLSCECFCGNPWKGNYYGEFEQQVLNLKNLFPDSAVIIGFRKQLPMITSMYKQFVQRGGTREVSYLYNQENTGVLKHEDFLYMKKIAFLQQHFEHIFFYTQENLQKNPQDFVHRVCNFLDIEKVPNLDEVKNKDANVGIKSNRQIQILRKANVWSHRLRKIHPILSPSHAVYQHLKVTPRDFIQFRGMFRKGEFFQFDENLQTFIENYYQEDWEKTLNLIS